MAKSKGPKFYAVRKGRVPGVYRTWNDCQAQTKGFSGAVFKSFGTMVEAQSFAGPSVSSQGNTPPVITAQRPAAPQPLTSSSRSSKRKSDPNDDPEGMDPSGPNKTLVVKMKFDGGSRGNPGLSGAGAHLIITERERRSKRRRGETDYAASPDPAESNQREIKIRHFCGLKCTNNVAEYNGLLQGLKEASLVIKEFCARLGEEDDDVSVTLDVKGDSNLIINQLNGLYACKNEGLKPLYRECKDIVQSLENIAVVRVYFEHVYRNDNKVADALANEAMDSQKSWTEKTGGPPDDVQETLLSSKQPKVLHHACVRTIRIVYDVEDV